MSSPETPQNPPPEGMPPSQPAYPQYPAAPQPGYPTPSQPDAPYPPAGQPGYPAPSQPYPPQVQPIYPTPSQPYGQPAMPYPSQPYPQYAPSGQPAPWPLGPDGQPLPPQMTPPSATAWGQLWPFWGWLVGGAVLVVLAVALFAGGTDWAAGAKNAGFALIFGAVVLLATLGIRAAGGLFAATNARRNSQIIGTGLAAVLLLAVAGVGIGAQDPIHVAQAHSLESAKNYARAIDEYQQGNAGAADLARTHNEWGEQLLANKRYTAAIAQFDAVLNGYSNVSDQLKRAQTGEAKAYYGVGTQALSASNYADAVTAFKTLTTKFPNDPATKQAHGPYAQALLGLGKSQLGNGGTGCTTALPTLQQLAKDFSDTPEGQQATTALAAPQPVRGQFTGTISNIPAGDSLLAVLVSTSASSSTQLPVALVNSTGQFEFGPIPQDSYNLAIAVGTVAGSSVSNVQVVAVFADQNKKPVVITTQPLCGTDLGTISGDINASPSVATQARIFTTHEVAFLPLRAPAILVATRWHQVSLVMPPPQYWWHPAQRSMRASA